MASPASRSGSLSSPERTPPYGHTAHVVPNSPFPNRLRLYNTTMPLDLVVLRHYVIVFTVLLGPITHLFQSSLTRNRIALLLISILTILSYLLPLSPNLATAAQFPTWVVHTHRTWLDLLINKPDFPGPGKRYRYARGTRKEEGMDIATERNLWKRLKWALDYFISVRGVNWSYKVDGCPPTPLSSAYRRRLPCIRRAAWSLFQKYLIIDLISNHWHKTQPFYVHGGMAEGYGSSAASPQGWVGGAVNGITSMMFGRLMMGIIYDLATVVTVALGMYEPEDYPPLFGSLKDTYTLRAFWGKYWHQMHRDSFLTVPNALLPHLPGISQSPVLKSYFRLFSAFLASALLHYRFSLEMPWPTTLPRGKNTGWRGGDQFVFFLGQAVAILAEDVVVALWTGRPLGPPVKTDGEGKEKAGMESQKTGVGLWKKMLGWTWLLVWFSVMGKYLGDEAAINGMGSTIQIPSLSKWVMGRAGKGGVMVV